MAGKSCWHQWIACVALTLAGGCNGNPARPSDTANVAGTWDARFAGTVQGRGTSQTDNFVMDLQQSGSSVTGTIRFQGLDLAIPVTGAISGRSFTYSASALLAPNCQATLQAQTTIDASGSQFSGSQTQSTCEGTAVGQVTATRR